VLYKTISAAVCGIDANLIEVEVDIAPIKDRTRLPTVGLPDAAVREKPQPTCATTAPDLTCRWRSPPSEPTADWTTHLAIALFVGAHHA
jgi:hypothetical protein